MGQGGCRDPFGVRLRSTHHRAMVLQMAVCKLARAAARRQGAGWGWFKPLLTQLREKRKDLVPSRLADRLQGLCTCIKRLGQRTVRDHDLMPVKEHVEIFNLGQVGSD